eukprot:GILI01030762.1.p1 GENE.GILI01030762.1~~GILI01030762.1.p1  ORF type:complete len:291 (-),score=63.28 GILI01030762.1:43-915(-)
MTSKGNKRKIEEVVAEEEPDIVDSSEEEEEEDDEKDIVDSSSEGEDEDESSDSSDDEEEEKPVEKKPQSNTAATVFVSGLPYEATQDQLSEFFANCGEITSIRLPQYRDTGRCLGYAHVEFSDESALKEALKLNGQRLGGRYLDIQASRDKDVKQTAVNKNAVPTGCRTVFVKQISYHATEDDIGDAFSWCGKVKSVRMVMDPVKGHFKGFAYVEFESDAAVRKALEMNGREIKGRRIFVDFDVGRAKGSYRPRPEAAGSKYFSGKVKQSKEEEKSSSKHPAKKKKLSLF